jgi:predicted AAA+ superfamily ATPase
MYRKQIEPIIKDLDKKIVFMVGPRQVGKTWLALSWSGQDRLGKLGSLYIEGT